MRLNNGRVLQLRFLVSKETPGKLKRYAIDNQQYKY